MVAADLEPSTCLPWEANMACCAEWEGYDAELQQRAQSLAWSTVRALTGGQVGGCPVLVRPCLDENPCDFCMGGTWMPHIDAHGNWKNCMARRNMTCSCCKLCEIALPGRAAAIEYVTIDGYLLDPRIFRIDNGTKLVRQDGRCFPKCQNMGAPAGAIGTMVISYFPGILPTEAGLWAIGVLTCEFAKACSGGKCRLPGGVTALVRQGLSFTIASSMFEGGTGIREVDAYISSVNPNRLKVASVVWSPDLPQSRHRITTWEGTAPVQLPEPTP